MTDVTTGTMDVYQGPATPAARWTYSEQMAGSSLLPTAFRQNPANVFYAVEYGAALGLPPIAAITGINVIEGKPSASASQEWHAPVGDRAPA